MATTATQAAFYGINIAGGTVLILLVATTIIARRAKRQPILMNMYITCIYEAFTGCFLFFANAYSESKDGIMTPRIQNGSPLCLAQAIMFTPTSPLVATAAFSLVLQIFLIVRSIKNSSSMVNSTPTFFLLALPYLVYGACLTPIAVTATMHPEHALPKQMYCTVDFDFSSYLIGIVSAVIVLVTLVLQGYILFMLRRDHRTLLARSQIDPSLILRGGLFAAYLVVTAGVGIQSVSDFTAVGPDMMIATVPIAVFIIFGAQRDNINVWRAAFTQHPAVTMKQWLASHHSRHEDAHAMHSMSGSHSRSNTSRTHATSNQQASHRSNVIVFQRSDIYVHDDPSDFDVDKAQKRSVGGVRVSVALPKHGYDIDEEREIGVDSVKSGLDRDDSNPTPDLSRPTVTFAVDHPFSKTHPLDDDKSLSMRYDSYGSGDVDGAAHPPAYRQETSYTSPIPPSGTTVVTRSESRGERRTVVSERPPTNSIPVRRVTVDTTIAEGRRGDVAEREIDVSSSMSPMQGNSHRSRPPASAVGPTSLNPRPPPASYAPSGPTSTARRSSRDQHGSSGRSRSQSQSESR